ncbi:carboxymuconolactone decarboxylase family protein [Alicyclobacillaceae bacterium I2511]|nr:carboxymuconolactone decarboxylase family protein [Alicyclobacillaceae bacterium I2511]
MNLLTQELIQAAAALAVGCTDCFESHVAKAKELDASVTDLQELLNLVRSVRLTATMQMDGFAEDLLAPQRMELQSVYSNTSCGCGSGSCCS